MNLKENQTFCAHVKKTEQEYWQRDGLMAEAIDSMTIHL
jgi:hypothetical protein